LTSYSTGTHNELAVCYFSFKTSGQTRLTSLHTLRQPTFTYPRTLGDSPICGWESPMTQCAIRVDRQFNYLAARAAEPDTRVRSRVTDVALCVTPALLSMLLPLKPCQHLACLQYSAVGPVPWFQCGYNRGNLPSAPNSERPSVYLPSPRDYQGCCLATV